DDGAIPIEVRDRENGVRVRGEDGFLVVQVRGAHGEDWSLGRGLLAEPLQVGLAERAFPRERLATDGPGPVTVAVFGFALCDLGRCASHPSHVVERRHPSTVVPCLAGDPRWGSACHGWTYTLQPSRWLSLLTTKIKPSPTPRQDLTSGLLRRDHALATRGEHRRRAAYTCLITKIAPTAELARPSQRVDATAGRQYARLVTGSRCLVPYRTPVAHPRSHLAVSNGVWRRAFCRCA